jgi:hypothetical protein
VGGCSTRRPAEDGHSRVSGLSGQVDAHSDHSGSVVPSLTLSPSSCAVWRAATLARIGRRSGEMSRRGPQRLDGGRHGGGQFVAVTFADRCEGRAC